MPTSIVKQKIPLIAYADKCCWLIAGESVTTDFDGYSLYIPRAIFIRCSICVFFVVQLISTFPPIYSPMSSSAFMLLTPPHHDAGRPPLAHPLGNLPIGCESTAMGVVKVGDARGRPADAPQSQKISVDEDGYSADIDAAVTGKMLSMAAFHDEGVVFKARFDSPELVQISHKAVAGGSYSPSSPAYDPAQSYSPSSPVIPDSPGRIPTPPLPKFTAEVPVNCTKFILNEIPSGNKRKPEAIEEPPHKRSRTTPDFMIPLPDFMIPLPEPTAEDMEDACKFLEQCMDVFEESETESDDEIFSDSSDSDDMEYHTSDDEIYPDECTKGEYDAKMAKFNGELAAFKKDGSYYDPRMGFPLFEGHAPVNHPYPLAFEQGAAPPCENCPGFRCHCNAN
mgnify:CR=1 FL=1